MSGELGRYTPEGLHNLGAASVFSKPFNLAEVIGVLGRVAHNADQKSYILMND